MGPPEYLSIHAFIRSQYKYLRIEPSTYGSMNKDWRRRRWRGEIRNHKPLRLPLPSPLQRWRITNTQTTTPIATAPATSTPPTRISLPCSRNDRPTHPLADVTWKEEDVEPVERTSSKTSFAKYGLYCSSHQFSFDLVPKMPQKVVLPNNLGLNMTYETTP